MKWWAERVMSSYALIASLALGIFLEAQKIISSSMATYVTVGFYLVFHIVMRLGKKDVCLEGKFCSVGTSAIFRTKDIPGQLLKKTSDTEAVAVVYSNGKWEPTVVHTISTFKPDAQIYLIALDASQQPRKLST